MNITVNTDKSRLDRDLIHHFLSQQSYWAQNIPRERVERSIDNAICFGAFVGEEQVGFARVVTDRAIFAYIGDVFVVPSYRGHGVSKRIMEAILAHPELQGLRRWSLVTADAHGLYEQFGFKPIAKPERHMEILDANPYG